MVHFRKSGAHHTSNRAAAIALFGIFPIALLALFTMVAPVQAVSNPVFIEVVNSTTRTFDFVVQQYDTYYHEIVEQSIRLTPDQRKEFEFAATAYFYSEAEYHYFIKAGNEYQCTLILKNVFAGLRAYVNKWYEGDCGSGFRWHVTMWDQHNPFKAESAHAIVELRAFF